MTGNPKKNEGRRRTKDKVAIAKSVPFTTKNKGLRATILGQLNEPSKTQSHKLKERKAWQMH